MLQFQIAVNTLKVTDGGNTVFSISKKDVYYIQTSLNEVVPRITLYNVNVGIFSVVFNALLSDCLDPNGNPFTVNSFTTFAEDNLGFNSGGASPSIEVTDSYATLPDPTTVSGQFYWCENADGTFPVGLYYSDGIAWQFNPADDITVVANYSALPNPTTVTGQFFWCEASQGTSWLPANLGGTYYSAGMYYSNGVSWSFLDVPYQATQLEVNTGTNTNKFVTPNTLSNSNWAFTVAKVLATTLSGLSIATGGSIIDTDTILIAFGKIQNQLNTIQTGLNNRDYLSVLFEKHTNVPTFGGASPNNVEGVAFTVAGGTSRNFADTNAYTRRQRMGLTVATAGNLAQARQLVTYFNRNSNLLIYIGLGFSENCTSSNVRVFSGVSTNTIFSNVEPTALLNCIGLAKLTTSNNVHLIHNDGSGTANPIDLGVNFPSNTIDTDFYILQLTTNGSNMDYLVTRVNTGQTASGTISSDLPSLSTALNLGYYVVQASGVSVTTGIDFFGTNLIKS